MTNTASQLVDRVTQDIASNSGLTVIGTFTPPDTTTTCYHGTVTVYGKDAENTFYTGCWETDIAPVKDGTIQHLPTDIEFITETIPFSVDTISARGDGAGNLEVLFDAEIALSQKARTGANTEFFTNQFQMTGTIDPSYEPHAVGRQSSNGNLGHLWFATDGTRNTEEVVATAVADKNQCVDAEFDSNGDLHVGFIDSLANVKYVKKSGGTWGAVETIATTAMGGLTNVGMTLDLDGSDVPYIAWNNDGTLYYADRTGGSWTSESSGLAIKKQVRSGLDIHVASTTLIGVVVEDGSDNLAIAIRDSGTWSITAITATIYRTPQLWHDGTNWAMSWIHGTNKDLHFASGNTTGGFSAEVVDDTNDYRSDYRTAAIAFDSVENQWTIAAFLNENDANAGDILMFTGTSGSWNERFVGAKVNELTGTGSDEANLEYGNNGFISSYVDVGQFGGSEKFAMAKNTDQGVTYETVAEFKVVSP